MNKDEMLVARGLFANLSNGEAGEVLSRFKIPSEIIKKIAPPNEHPLCTCLCFCSCDVKYPDPPKDLELLSDSMLSKISLDRLVEIISRTLGPS